MTIFQLLRDDHHRLRLILENLIETTSRSIEPHTTQPSLESGRRWLGELEMVHLAHSRAEELVLYERLRFLPHRDGLADQQLEEHRMIEETLDELAQMDPTDDKWDEALSLVKNQLESHLASEETTVFPILELAVEQEEAERLARDFEISRDDILAHVRAQRKTAPLQAPFVFSGKFSPPRG